MNNKPSKCESSVAELAFVVTEYQGIGQDSLEDQLQSDASVTWTKYPNFLPNNNRQYQNNKHKASKKYVNCK